MADRACERAGESDLGFLPSWTLPGNYPRNALLVLALSTPGENLGRNARDPQGRNESTCLRGSVHT